MLKGTARPSFSLEAKWKVTVTPSHSSGDSQCYHIPNNSRRVPRITVPIW